MPSRSVRRSVTVLLAVAGIGLGLSGCGSTPEDDYAAGWDDVCSDVSAAYRQFRTDLVSAARSAPDRGDAAAAHPLSPADAAAVLARPARKLQRALRPSFRAAHKLDAPARWSAWNRTAVQRLDAQSTVVTSGLRQVEAGDANALSSLSLGGFGPAADDAPAELRDHTPACTGLR